MEDERFMMLQYVDADTIAKYLKDRPSVTGTPEQLASMVNFFAEGAVTGVGNFLYTQLVENYNELRHGLQKGCRCGSCYEWQIVAEDGSIVASAESISDWAIK